MNTPENLNQTQNVILSDNLINTECNLKFRGIIQTKITSLLRVE